MSTTAMFQSVNRVKADMDHIYNQADPRSYFSELEKLSYAIPKTANPIFKALIDSRKRALGRPVHVLDLGCSYGVNAALLKYDVSMEALYDHWRKKEQIGASSEAIVTAGRRFFSSLPKIPGVEVTGIDQAENAIAFGTNAGLLDNGFVVNLETQDVRASERQLLTSVDLVISTGCIGYVTEKSFDRLLPIVAQNQPPWIANFVLRSFPFDAIEKSLSKWGYATEKLEDRTFFQRMFASQTEQDQIVGKLVELGIDPRDKEANGKLVAELYVSYPANTAPRLLPKI